MTADEYFQILCPTDADFRTWTQSMLARADELNERLEREYPHLFGAKKDNGEFRLEAAA